MTIDQESTANKDQESTGFVARLFQVAGFNSRKYELGSDGKFKESSTTSFFRFPRPRVHRGSGRYRISSNPNSTKGGNRQSQGNGSEEDGN